jgi:Uma2 family endonuclease
MIRVKDFLGMGVEEVWIVDSESKSVHRCHGNVTTELTAGKLPIPGTAVSLSLDELFQGSR